MSHQIFCENALLGNSWARHVLLSVDDDGRISTIKTGQLIESNGTNRPGELLTFLDGFVIPGMPNVHSHAFQRAFVGLSEFRTNSLEDNGTTGDDTNTKDSFWTWRELMYRFLSKMTDDDIYSVAKQLFTEMLTAGYTTVGEFQYVHNDCDGQPYPQSHRVSHLVIQAAVDVGLPICIIPVLYQRGGFDNRPLQGGQRRFFFSENEFVKMVEGLKENWAHEKLVSFGFAFHSLRAVEPKIFDPMIDRVSEIVGDCPIHIHIAEQKQEVADCLTATGHRPVELLMQQSNVNDRWCLIHATHLSDEEVGMITKSGATVGLCPMTEANLGDGVFRGQDFKTMGGKISIGSDSHISVDPRSELRMFEYSQRLTQFSRASMCTSDRSCGNWLYWQSAKNGCHVVSRDAGEIAIGKIADLVSLDPNHGALFDLDYQHILDKMIFFDCGSMIKDVVIGGNRVICDGRHPNAQETRAQFADAMGNLI